MATRNKLYSPRWYVRYFPKHVYKVTIAIILFVQIEFHKGQHYLQIDKMGQ